MQTTKDLRIQQLEIEHFEIYARQHGTCVKKSQKGAEVKKKILRNTQDTDDRQEVFPSS